MKEPTRVAQFDDMMYGDYLALSDDFTCSGGGSQINYPTQKWMDSLNEEAEEAIGRSHSLDSDFGFNKW